MPQPPQPGSGSPSCTAAWRAAEALLRLLPTLPGQPVSTRTGWRSAAAIVADRGGPEAYDEHAEQQGFTDVVPAPLAQVSLRAAWQLLCIGPPSPHAMAPAEVAQAACDALSTACRAAHKLAPLFRPGSGNEGSLLVQQDLLALMRVLDAAMRSALQACGAWLAALPQGKSNLWQAGALRPGRLVLDCCGRLTCCTGGTPRRALHSTLFVMAVVACASCHSIDHWCCPSPPS